MTKLNDKSIREYLINRLNSQSTKPKAILEELHIHNGNAIADVVALYQTAHCYEIKGDGDKIERITGQGYYFDSSFRKITLITTNKHAKKAFSITPEHWGIIVVTINKQKNITAKHIRSARLNPRFQKSLAALALWKDEMLTLIDEDPSKLKRMNRRDLAEILSKRLTAKALSDSICNALLKRKDRTDTKYSF